MDKNTTQKNLHIRNRKAVLRDSDQKGVVSHVHPNVSEDGFSVTKEEIHVAEKLLRFDVEMQGWGKAKPFLKYIYEARRRIKKNV